MQSHITQHSYIGKLCNVASVYYCNYQWNKIYSHFECYEMDVLKYIIGCSNKTKITFRLNKNCYFISVALRVKNRAYAKLCFFCASTHHEIKLVGIKARQVRVHKNDPFITLLSLRLKLL